MTNPELLEAIETLAGVARTQGDQEVERWFNALAYTLATKCFKETKNLSTDYLAKQASWLFDLNEVLFKSYLKKYLLGQPNSRATILETVRTVINQGQTKGAVSEQQAANLRRWTTETEKETKPEA